MYTQKAHIHFIGIGGIGMSGIAKILKQQGYTISGCDSDPEQKNVKELQALGCSIYTGNNTPACNDSSINILVYSSAINNTNPEILAAQKRGIPTIPRALMLAELMRTKYSIAIAGAHGKTTTTSMIAHILLETHKDPTVIVGGHLQNLSSNAYFGSGNFLVAEADESDRSFLRLYPTLAVVTNIDREHLDVYQDIEDIKQAFAQFIGNIPFYGKAFVCNENEYVRDLLPKLSHVKCIKYGLTKDSDVFATDIELGDDSSFCSLWNLKNGIPELLGKLTIPMPGKHNILNALAATSVALDLEIPFQDICKAFATFKGIDRRFSYKGTAHGALIYDDYAHHPEEIRNALAVARKKAKKKLIVVFQPHRYTRTKLLWHEFIEVLGNAGIDHLIMTDIYPASETPLEGITTTNLIEALKQSASELNVTYATWDESLTTIKSVVTPLLTENDLLLLLGAGKMNKLAEKLENNS